MNHFISKFWYSCGIAALALLLAGNIASAQTPPPGDEVIFSGFLSCGGVDDSRQCPFRLHYVNLTQGKTYALRMDSSEFDAHLAIEDQHGNVLATDTDCMDEDMFGCIWFRPPTTGRYRLVVTSLAPLREGFYQITMRELPIVMRVEAELTAADTVRDDCYERVHEVTLTEGQRYIIHLESMEYSTCLKLLSPEGMIVAFHDEGMPSNGARIIYEAPRTGTYRLVAASMTPHAVGAFTLTVCSE